MDGELALIEGLGMMELDGALYLSDPGVGELSAEHRVSFMERKRRRRWLASKLSVNKPITKADFSAPQLCVNRKMGGMRRNWSFLSLHGGDESPRVEIGQDTSKAGSPETSCKRVSERILVDPLLAAEEDLE